MAENCMKVRIADGADCKPALRVEVTNMKGVWPALVAGAAQSLVGPKVSAGPAVALAAPATGVAIFDTIKGRTLVWNQLVTDDKIDFSNPSVDTKTTLVLYVTARRANNATITSFSCDSTLGYHSSIVTMPAGTASLVFKHNGSTSDIYVYTTPAVATHKYFIGYNVVSEDPTTVGGMVINNNCCIDLTAMFGAGYEPATVAEFMALFPNFPYSYNAGTLLPFKGAGLKVTGFNQLVSAPINFASTSWPSFNPNTYTRVVAGVSYFFRHDGLGVTNWRHAFKAYDLNGNEITDNLFDTYSIASISYSTVRGAFLDGANNSSTQITMSFIRDCYIFVGFGLGEVTSTTEMRNACINLSNPSINGQYLPYEERTLSLPIIGKTAKDAGGNPIVPYPTGMHGTPTVFDTATKAGGVKRRRTIDLGDYNWTYANDGKFTLDISAEGYAKPAGGTVPDIICSKYTTSAAATSLAAITTDKSITMYVPSTAFRIVVVDTAYSDATVFKAAVAGVKCDIELATPIPFTWDEPLEMVAPVAEGGVLELQPEGVDAQGVPATAPLAADIKWPVSIASLEGTLDNLLDALKTAGVITAYTMTYNAATGKYDFTIN